ncbi:hypothetical protein ACRRTK_016979 [Alexandromys fortis]
MCTKRERERERKKERKKNSSFQCFTVKGKKPRQTFCQNLAKCQGITSKLVVYTIKLHPFFKQNQLSNSLGSFRCF